MSITTKQKKREYPIFTEPDFNSPAWKAAIKHMGNLIREWIDEQIIQEVIKEAKKK